MKWTTPSRIAREMGVRQSTPKRWIRDGLLPAVNIGTEARPNYRILEDDFQEFLARRAVVPEVKPVRRARRDPAIPRYV